MNVTLDRLSVPSPATEGPEWGSDVAAEMLRRLGVEYVALNPGASFRGLHDSLVNYQGNERPGMILCNHEEVAVAIAHGYFKVAGRPMGAILHSNVGLLHGAMSIFNAFADRAPVYVMGATGPMDATRRRPWIDWIHTSFTQGQVVRDYTKWEHQPSSVAAFPEAMIRGWHMMLTEPYGPVYICFDAGLQEQHLDSPVSFPDLSRYPLPGPQEPSQAAIEEAARLLAGAQFPAIMLGRVESTQQAWDDLVALAETLGAAVIGDAKSPAAFPTTHYLFQGGMQVLSQAVLGEVLGQADVVLSLDRIDVAGSLRGALGTPGAERAQQGAEPGRPWPKLINVSLEPHAVRSWTADFQEMPPADVPILANTARTIHLLLDAVRREVRDNAGASLRIEQRMAALRESRAKFDAFWEQRRQQVWEQSPVSVARLAADLRTALGADYENAILARMPLTWAAGVWEFTRPLSFLGSDGGGGIGSGPGMSVGAALAARGTGRTVVAILGDGDTLMAPSALWTAAHHKMPLLVVVANNQSYFNDEEHQDRVARVRRRPPENRWIGQRMAEPAVDFAGLARSLGVEGFGPVGEPGGLAAAYAGAVAAVREGRPALVDVRITPR